ncbi:MAG: hypothetical protein LBD45_04625 [Bacteroidales bacterium]|nr:hypothetical protein [Bacteroidales bacterium]
MKWKIPEQPIDYPSISGWNCRPQYAKATLSPYAWTFKSEGGKFRES